MTIVCNDPMVRRRLAAYAAERNELLTAIVGALQRDSRVMAAWLFGSIGRGTADELSDLDLFVIIEDDRLAEVIETRYAMLSSVGGPLLILEAPQNAPPGGAYNMALYPGAEGPYQVDWYWQGRSAAAIPAQTHVLFDRVGLSHLEMPPRFDYQPVPERDPVDVAAQGVNFFWVMLLIAAKYLARSPHERGLGLAQYCQAQLRGASEFVGSPLPDAENAGEQNAATAVEATPAERVAALRDLQERMLQLMPAVEAKGAHVPWKVVEPARRYLTLIEETVCPAHNDDSAAGQDLAENSK